MSTTFGGTFQKASAYWVNRKVLVTGGCGFIGRHLVAALRNKGAIVRVLDEKNGCEIRAKRSVEEIVNGVNPEVVFHLAAFVEVGRSLEDPYEAYSVNVEGTLNILEACRRASTPPRLIVASTDKVYGPHVDPPSEGIPFAHTPSPYGQSKQMADKLCQDYQKFYKLPIHIVRMVNTYGEHQLNETTLITGTALRIMRGGTPILHERDCKREWLYIDDAISAYLKIGESDIKSKAVDVMNVGSGERLRSSEVIWAIHRELGCSDPANETIEHKKSDIYDFHQFVDSTKFRTWFPEWKPTPFSKGIKQTIAWYKKEFEEGRLK